MEGEADSWDFGVGMQYGPVKSYLLRICDNILSVTVA